MGFKVKPLEKKLLFHSMFCLLFLLLYLLEPERMEDTGLGQAGMGDAAVLAPRLAAPWVNCTEG